MLLSIEDFCDWVDFDFLQRGRDTFKGKFVIREEQIRLVDSAMVDPVSVEERDILDTQDRRITMLFIYENWCIKGEAGTMRYYNKSLISNTKASSY